MSTPARFFSNSPAMCWGVPTPGEAKDSFPGSAFARAKSSATVFAGTSLLTARMLGITRTRAIGARSRTGMPYRIEGWARLQRWVDSHCAVGPPIECAAVGGRFCHALGPDTPAGTRNILDRHRHVPGVIQFLRK